MAVARTRTSKSAVPKGAAASRTAMTCEDVMKVLEQAGSSQTKKTYLRHGAAEPLFGVSFATLGSLVKKIGVNHDLAMSLWETGNFDARNLAFKIADPSRLRLRDLDRWARETTVRLCVGYVSMIGAERSDGLALAERWLASKDEALVGAGWGLVSQLAARDLAVPDAWFNERLDEIVQRIHAAPNAMRVPLNQSLITIGGRSAGLRKAALAAAKRIGPVDIDYGDTQCATPDATATIEKMWSHAKAKGFASPTAQECSRKPPRTRC